MIKDAGDDPDVTHRRKSAAARQLGRSAAKLQFERGHGVGLVTRPGCRFRRASRRSIRRRGE